ncbi:MAG: hypothetical protein WDZ49_09290 [Litorilinea sp.]
MSNDELAVDATELNPVAALGAWLGGSVIQVALSPNFAQDGIALAATLAGLFRSADRGQSWQLAMTGLSEPTLTTVIFAGAPDAAPDSSESAPPTAFASTEGGRLYRSTDMGQTWKECAGWAGLGVMTDLAAAPNFDAQPYLFAATIHGAFRSLDGGESWESCTFGLLDDEVLCMVCAPDFADNELVWCGTGGGGFYRSRNAAKAWREAGLGLPDSAVQALAVSPHFATDRTLYAGMEDGGLYQSPDGGENWTVVGRATEPLPGAINCLALTDNPHATANADTPPALRILAGTNWGIFWSDDGGDTWEAAAGGDFIALDLAPHATGVVIAGALSDGLFVSTDGGKSWAPTAAPPAAHAPPLITAPNTTRLFALDHDGVPAQSWDGGATWSELPGEFSQGHVTDAAVFSIAAGDQSADSLTVYLAGEDFLLRGTTPRTQSAIEWDELTLPAPAGDAAPFVVAAPDFSQSPSLLWGHYSGDMYLSADAGETWSLIARPWVTETTLSINMSPGFAADRRMVAVTGHQNDAGNFQLSLWQTHNAGEMWAELAALETETPAMLTALTHHDREESIFLATRNRLIRLFTPGGGDDLEVQQTMFETGQRITALAVSPDFANDGTLFAGIDGCVHYSQDSGVTWAGLARIPHDIAVVSLLPAAPGQPLTLVTLGGEVWRCPWPATA